MQRISSEHPGYPVRVLSGDLVENPTTTGEMMRNHPTMREFFVRLAKTTGQAVGQDFLRRLEPGQGDLRMFSPDMAVPLAALKKLAPGHELEQMEAFQSAFYGEGRDVLAPEVQMRIANVGGDVFMRALEDPGVQAAAEELVNSKKNRNTSVWITSVCSRVLTISPLPPSNWPVAKK